MNAERSTAWVTRGNVVLAWPLPKTPCELEGGAAPGDTHSLEGVYMGGALLTLPTPDFSMPFNVTTMVCTLMSLLAGALLTTLTRRPGWAGFRERKAEQRRRLRALQKEAKKAS